MNKYVILAGVNGAGKSTLYQSLVELQHMKRINNDEIVRSFGDWRNASDVIKAGKMAVSEINNAFESLISFNQETTLCGRSILKNIERAKALGYHIELHYVGVENVGIAKSRIAYRVEHGGHGIPDIDVERRYTESFKNLKNILGKCNLVVLYDNTISFNRFAIYKDGKLISLSACIPLWYDRLFDID
jgi:predicted ABC-type ATPase